MNGRRKIVTKLYTSFRKVERDRSSNAMVMVTFHTIKMWKGKKEIETLLWQVVPLLRFCIVQQLFNNETDDAVVSASFYFRSWTRATTAAIAVTSLCHIHLPHPSSHYECVVSGHACPHAFLQLRFSYCRRCRVCDLLRAQTLRSYRLNKK